MGGKEKKGEGKKIKGRAAETAPQRKKNWWRGKKGMPDDHRVRAGTHGVSFVATMLGMRCAPYASQHAWKEHPSDNAGNTTCGAREPARLKCASQQHRWQREVHWKRARKLAKFMGGAMERHERGSGRNVGNPN